MAGKGKWKVTGKGVQVVVLKWVGPEVGEGVAYYGYEGVSGRGSTEVGGKSGWL